MTRQRFDGKDTEFGQWLRKEHPRLIGSQRFDCQNLDYVWHDYRNGKIMLLEEKRNAAKYPDAHRPAQRDTHGILDQALAFACEHTTFNRVFSGRPKEIQYYGYNLVQFENTSPDDGWIKVNGIYVTLEQLLKFLQFEEWKGQPTPKPAHTIRRTAVGVDIEWDQHCLPGVKPPARTR